MPIVIFYLLLLPILWFSPKLRHIIIILLIGFYAIYDLIDYSTIYHEVDIIVKILPEVLLFGFIILYLLQKMWHIGHHNLRYLLLSIILIFSVLSLVPFHDVTVMSEIFELRFIFRPILFSILIIETCRFSERQFQLIVRSFLFFSLIICIVGIYQYYTFEGDYTAVWRFEPLLNAKLEKNEYFLARFMKYQIVRNDHLRASGPFYSALDFGFLAGLFTSTCYIYFFNTRENIKRIPLFVGIIIGFWACYVSGVRTSFVLFSFVAIWNIILTKSIVVERRNHIFILISVSLSIFLFFGLFELYVDSSATSRIKQLYRVLSLFSPIGHGFSADRFDSAFLYYINSLGLLSIPLIIFTFYMFSPNRLFNNVTISVDARILYVSGLSILFIMFFQFTIGGFVYNSILILMACYLTIQKYDTHSKKDL